MFALGFREGLEAAVVVATAAAVLRHTRFQRRLVASVGAATATCVVVVLLVRSVNATASEQTRQLVKLLVATGAVMALTSTARWLLRYGSAGPAGAPVPISPPQAAALIGTASLAMVREGIELAVLPAASAHDRWSPGWSLLAGVAMASAIGVVAYVVGSRALGASVRVWAPLMLLLGAGLTTAVVRSAHAAFGIDPLTAFEIGWLAALPAWLHELVRGLFGWHANPSVGEALVYGIYVVGAAALLLRCWPARDVPRPVRSWKAGG